MRVGSSPVYFLQEHEPLLERYSNFLKSKEKEAFTLLKEKKFLKDTEQDPAIRVALRSIRDFAIPFKNKEDIYWRFFIEPQESFKPEKAKGVEIMKKEEENIQEKSKGGEEQELKKSLKEEEISEQDKIKKLTSEIEEKLKKEFFSRIKKESLKQKIKKSKKRDLKMEDIFLEEIKVYLKKENIELGEVEFSNKKEIIARVKIDEKEVLLVAFNKKRIDEKDIIKAHKKASFSKIKYLVISKGDVPKKIKESLEAYNNLYKISSLS
jgi:hypothetical protein